MHFRWNVSCKYSQFCSLFFNCISGINIRSLVGLAVGNVFFVFVLFFKSELLYPEGTISPSGGISADILCKGRDYLVSSGIFVWS